MFAPPSRFTMLCLTSVFDVRCVAIEAKVEKLSPQRISGGLNCPGPYTLHYRILQWLPGMFSQLTPGKLAFLSLEAVLCIDFQTALND